MQDANSNNDPQQYHRKKAAVLSVEKFAHRKGVTKALQKFQQRRETKRVDRAKLHRAYKKVLEKEGYNNSNNNNPDATSPRKRKRVEQEDNDNDESLRGERKRNAPVHDKTDKTEDNSLSPETETKITRSKNQKEKESSNNNNTNNNKSHPQKLIQKPYTPSLQKAAQRRMEQIEKSIQEKEERERQKKQKIQQRKQRTKLLQQRTAKGQPVLQNVVHDILHKLQQQQQQTK